MKSRNRIRTDQWRRHGARNEHTRAGEDGDWEICSHVHHNDINGDHGRPEVGASA